MLDSFGFNVNTARNIVDVVLVWIVLYRLLLIIKGTRAVPMLVGLTFIVALYFLARPFGLVTLGWILENFLSSIILIVVVVFQDEIRRALTKVGLQRIFRSEGKTLYNKAIEDITLVCTNLAKEKLGALIVIQREVGLDEFVEDAVILDAQLNRKLLFSLFVKGSSLHDGAVLIDRGQIRAAGCVLPLSFNPDLDPSLGTRHRAAIGLSERSDAVIIVVSEETGAISLVRDGRMIRNLDGSVLRDSLHRLLSDEKNDEVSVEVE
ncbi:MAG: diadenylate cyclase CdaA [Bdellovibrionales bacterium]|nr:diadenylate cyclase CdaA [Bdellovibrionales bacterium]